MNCVGCRAKLDPAYVFCPHCGRAQAADCAYCGATWNGFFAFCPHCGKSQRGVAPEPKGDSGTSDTVVSDFPSDRRIVTVLFADVAGFTTLCERLDPEDVRAFQNELFQALSLSVARFGGFVEKFVGDAVLAVFGAPTAHEDDPERALDAALHMVAQSRVLSERWAAKLGTPLTLHVGVNTGGVVAGNFDVATGPAYAVTGDTVNTAARLLAAAKDTILVSETTCILSQHRFDFEPHPDLSLRGKTESIRVRRLIGPLAQPQSPRGLTSYGLTAPMIGRGDELDQLLAAYQRARRGRTQVISVIGEAGLGKSRLVGEFLGRLEADGDLGRVALRKVVCSSLGEPTYGVFRALFREAYQVDRTDPPSVAREKLMQGLRELGTTPELIDDMAPMLGYVLGVESFFVEGVEPEQLKRQITFAACTLLDSRLRQQPLLIVVEDLHWADAASVELLCEIADRLSDRPFMILLSHRPETSSPKLSRVAQTVVRLSPLSKEQTQALVSSLFGAIEPSCAPRLVDVFLTRAAGNPYFVEEIARGLINEGALVRRAEGWSCAEGHGADDVPPTLGGLLLSRIDKLSPDARRVVQAASVIGLEFDHAALRSLCPNLSGIGELLLELCQVDLIESDGYGVNAQRYHFKHALVRDAVYQNLLLAHRCALHALVGEALERSILGKTARLDELEALGHHWSLSLDKLKGARYLGAAGDWARDVYANEDAVRHYRRALRALEHAETSSDVGLRIRENLADILALQGRRDEARVHYDILLEEYQSTSQRACVARVERKVGCLLWDAGDREGANARFSSGLGWLGEQDRTERAQLFQEMGLLAFRTGDNARAIEYARSALQEASVVEESGPDASFTKETAEIRAHAYNTIGVALARQGRLEEAIIQIRRSVELAEAYDLARAICRGCANLGVLYGSADPKLGIATCVRGLEAAKKSGDLGFESRLYANLAIAYCVGVDRCDHEGVEAAHRAIELDRRLGYFDHLAAPLVVLGQIHQCHGNSSEAFACYREALEIAERIREPQLLFPCYDGLATLYLESGESELGESYLTKAHELCEQAHLDPDALMVLPFLT